MIYIDENKKRISIKGNEGQLIMQVELALSNLLLTEVEYESIESAIELLELIYLNALRSLNNNTLKERIEQMVYLCRLPEKEFLKEINKL